MKSNIKLKFGEKELEFVYGLSFLGKFYDDFGKNVSDIIEDYLANPHGMIPTLMYESYKHGLERKGLTLNHTKWEFTDLLEECGGVSSDDSPAVEFIKNFIDSLQLNLPKTDEKKDEVKKK